MNIRRIVLAGILILALVGIGGAQSWWTSQDFLATGVSCGTSASVVNQTGFGSATVRVSYIGRPSTATLTMTFTRAAGSATLTADFYFQVSYDNGTTWADFHDAVSDADYLSIITGHAVVSGTTVRVSRIISIAGISHIRLAKITNNDSANALTLCNATVSW